MTARLVGIARRLVAQNLIDEAIAHNANEQAVRHGIPLLHYLVSNNLVGQDSIAYTISCEFQLPLIEISSFDLSYCPEGIIDSALIRKHRILPLAIREKLLFLAIADPSDLNSLRELEFHSGLKIEPVIAQHKELESAIAQYLQWVDRRYASQVSNTSRLDAEVAIEPLLNDSSEEDLHTFDDTPLVRFINNLLTEAVTLNASDIHFEPYESTYRVRFRIDGLLQEMTRPPISLTARLASRIKIMAHLDIAEKRIPQDGRIRIRLSEHRTIDFRVSSLPTLWGEKIVMRVLDPMKTKLDLNTLGLEPQQQLLYLQALRKQQGLILVTGPTGSGKSRTLYCGLNYLNLTSKNIATVEDPVEITIDGINQIAINSKTGMSFASALRATLRQDPDIIMLGEIRDLESAQTVLRAAQTGHLVLSTLHTLSAAASLNRLRDMGIPAYNLANTVSLVVAQRLARRLCESCKESVELPEKVLIEQGFTDVLHPEPQLYRARGCADCSGGFKGRVGFYEVVPISEGLSRIIMNDGQPQRFTEHMREHSMPKLREAALLKVAQGLTSLDEANRLT